MRYIGYRRLSKFIWKGKQCRAWCVCTDVQAAVDHRISSPSGCISPVLDSRCTLGYSLEKRNIHTACFLSKEKGLDTEHCTEEISSDILLEDEHYQHLISDVRCSVAGMNNVAVLQPWVKWGPHMRCNTTSKLLLDEACTLAQTLPYTNVCYKEIFNVPKPASKQLFGSGTRDRLVKDVKGASANTVFISVDMLSGAQVREMQQLFGMRVVDRYTVVLGIFHYYAKSLESKLQIALAELPFARRNVYSNEAKMCVDDRERRLKETLARVASRRSQVRQARSKISLPSVAIVGYTNCGKTTLIRALTGDLSIQGLDRLFATLDVTAHGGRLKCGLNVAYLDTVGFVQDIPTSLIASFKATLEDAIYADVIVHVRDVSHPDRAAQSESVVQTLSSLPFPPKTPIIIVDNKVDLVTNDQGDDDVLKICAITGQGLSELLDLIEEHILLVTGRKMYKLVLPTGSNEIQWLERAAGVAYKELDEANPQNSILHVVMNDAEVAAFRRTFRKHSRI